MKIGGDEIEIAMGRVDYGDSRLGDFRFHYQPRNGEQDAKAQNECEQKTGMRYQTFHRRVLSIMELR